MFIRYNDEISLVCIITLVYLSDRSKYKFVRKNAGVSFAEFIFYLNDKSKPEFIELKKFLLNAVLTQKIPMYKDFLWK